MESIIHEGWKFIRCLSLEWQTHKISTFPLKSLQEHHLFLPGSHMDHGPIYQLQKYMKIDNTIKILNQKRRDNYLWLLSCITKLVGSGDGNRTNQTVAHVTYDMIETPFNIHVYFSHLRFHDSKRFYLVWYEHKISTEMFVLFVYGVLQ